MALLLALAVGCASVGRDGRDQALRISEVADAGDATRRASTRLVLDGLASDAAHRQRQALSQYERAIQVDPTNPYAYLALARHYADRSQPERTLAYLERSEALLSAQGAYSPRVEPHLLGLRGGALYGGATDDEAAVLLARASQMAPSVWGDGSLSPQELR
jgi:tetratricopeptide (TPR) repeat protein